MGAIRWPFALAVVAIAMGLLAHRPAQAQTPPPAPPPSATATPAATATPGAVALAPPPGDPPSFLPDPQRWAGEVFEQVLTQLLESLASALRAAIGGVLSSSLNFVTQTPPTGSYASPTVQALRGAIRLIANAALALVVVGGASM